MNEPKLIAATWGDIIGTINVPSQITYNLGKEGIENFTERGIALILSVSIVILLFMIIMGAYQWLTSGGDKEAIAKARARITNAIFGIILMSLAYLITRVIGDVIGFNIVP